MPRVAATEDIENAPMSVVNAHLSNQELPKSGKKHRASLVAGEARRDRFLAAQRKGTGRIATQRDVAVARRTTPVADKKNKQFEDVDAVFGNQSSLLNSGRKSLVDESPFRATEYDFNADDDDDDDDDDTDAEAEAEVKKQLNFEEDAASSRHTPAKSPGSIKSAGNTQGSGQKRKTPSKSPMMKAPAPAPAPAAVEDVPDDYPMDEPAFAAETVTPGAESKRSPAPVKEKKKKTTEGAKRKRRQTNALLEEAKRAGILDEGKAESRFGRKRWSPLQYWKNERVIMKRSNDGIGEFLPTVVGVERAAGTPMAEKLKAARRREIAANAAAARKKLKMSREGESDSENEAGVPDLECFANVYDGGNEKKLAAVVKHERMIKFADLVLPGQENFPSSRLPKAGKMFESSRVQMGVLVIPPNSSKAMEKNVSRNEHFYVLRAEDGCLRLIIEGSTLPLTKKCSIRVPNRNTYMIENTSATKKAKLLFVVEP